MAAMVPEQTMWVVLQAIRKTAGPQSERILTAAGMSRFLTRELSRTSFSPVATTEELVALYGQIYAMLGEDLTRLLYRNYGEIIAEGLLQLPWVAQLRADAQAVPPDQQVRWFAQTFGAMTARTWTPHIISEDATAAYMAPDPCLMCAGIHGVKKPLCAAGEVVFGRVARECLGRRVRVVEVECAAQGAPHCKYALYK